MGVAVPHAGRFRSGSVEDGEEDGGKTGVLRVGAEIRPAGNCPNYSNTCWIQYTRHANNRLLERPLVEGVDAPHKRPTPLLIYLFIHLRPQNKSVNRIAPHCESYCLFPSKFSSCYKISARPGSVGVGMMANRWSWFHGDDDRAASSWEKR